MKLFKKEILSLFKDKSWICYVLMSCLYSCSALCYLSSSSMVLCTGKRIASKNLRSSTCTSSFFQPFQLITMPKKKLSTWSYNDKYRKYHQSTITMMPEGPEVKIVVDQLQPAVGMRLANIHFLSGLCFSSIKSG